MSSSRNARHVWGRCPLRPFGVWIAARGSARNGRTMPPIPNLSFPMKPAPCFLRGGGDWLSAPPNQCPQCQPRPCSGRAPQGPRPPPPPRYSLPVFEGGVFPLPMLGRSQAAPRPKQKNEILPCIRERKSPSTPCSVRNSDWHIQSSATRSGEPLCVRWHPERSERRQIGKRPSCPWQTSVPLPSNHPDQLPPDSRSSPSIFLIFDGNPTTAVPAHHRVSASRMAMP